MDSRYLHPARHRNRRALIVPAVFLACWFSASARAQESVLDTVHNLSRSGPGAVKSATETDACRFCHVPHAAEPRVPLWGHALSTAVYTVYASDSLDSTVPQPEGSSRLCLACHDGTIALGDLHGARVGLGRLPGTSSAFLGTDLSGGHPVSMAVTPAVIARNNAAAPTLAELSRMQADADGVRLDPAGRMQCSSCHSVHSDANHGSSGIHFWRKSTFSEACIVCHLP